MIKSVALYPEYLEKERFESALRLAKEGGIQAIRFGEFAWSLIEPKEGEFDWEAFDRAFELTEKMGMQVILCTPTACPPAWLCKTHPDILPVNEFGQTIDFGARQHRCYTSPAMRKAMAPVVSALSKRYGRRKNLLGWQIDNELGAEHKYCYCDACRKAFQDFLAEKYGNVNEMNRRFMGVFWSQSYTDFSEVPLPRMINATLTMRPHPSLMYEYLRFSSKSVVDFCHAQADLLRAHSDAPITTNQDDFYYGDNVNWDDMFGALDVVGFDIYSQRLYELAFYFDMCYRIKNKPFWQMEYGGSMPCLIEAMTLAVKKGCDLVGLFAFAPFSAGQEQGIAAMIDHLDRPRPNYAEFRDWQPPKCSRKKPQVAVLYDFDSAYALNAETLRHWETGFEQVFSRLGYKEYMIHTLYKTLFESGIEAAVVTRLSDIDPAIPLLLPNFIVHTKEKAEALLQYMEKGGVIYATDNLFLKDDANAFHRELPGFYAALEKAEEGYPPEADSKQLYKAGGIHFLNREAVGEAWLKVIGVE